MISQKWRSGSFGKFKTGTGQTLLLNEQGFMCCLGQFSLQCGLTKKDILNHSILTSTHKIAEKLYNEQKGGELLIRPGWSEACIKVNDNPDTTPEEKLLLLTLLCHIEGYTLKIKNYRKIKRHN